MNWQQFRTLVWLRWRLLVNQLRKGGTVNFVLLMVIMIAGAAAALALFFTAFLVGLMLLGDVNPNILLYIWDGLALFFLFIWMIGLMIDLQRSEVLSLDKFLHLPVSLSGAFLINYLSSLISLTMLFFLPSMAALSLGLAFARGPAMLALFPLLAAFYLMITGPTYQLQGWLASLMSNPRRRRNAIVLVMMAFILICQVPNAVNIYFNWGSRGQNQFTEANNESLKEKNEIQQRVVTGQITQAEGDRLKAEVDKRTEEKNSQTLQSVVNIVEIMSVILPPGWLGLGARGAAEGNFLPVLLGFLGMGGIGAFSLWRAYRTTIRLYTGYYTSKKRSQVAQPLPSEAPATAASQPAGTSLLERELPWVSEQAAAVALGGFRSLVRAPEAKLVLLTPIILLVVFGGMFVAQGIPVGERFRPLMAFGGTSMVLLGMFQLATNQFGFDRAGFRIYVLSGAPRREVLLGKNLALAPLAFGLAAILDLVLEVFYPMRLDNLLAIAPQAVTMYVLYCMLANTLSILAPMPIRPGSLKPMNPHGMQILIQLLSAFLFPLVLLPALVPLGIELLAGALDWPGFPFFLVLSLLEAALAVLLYRVVLTWQGNLLQAREQQILEVVAARAE